MELSWLNWLYTAVAQVIIWIHQGYSSVLDPNSGLTWALTIVTLTVLMRLLIFPLFLKQMRSSKKMQELGPQVAEIRKRYKNDKQRMNQEVMALYQGQGANPLGGCLPVVAQFPIFISMFTVLNAMAHGQLKFGMTQQFVDSARQRAHLRCSAARDLLEQCRADPRTSARTRSRRRSCSLSSWRSAR